MDPTLTGEVITNIATQAAGLTNVLVPIGLNMAQSLIIVGIVALGASLFFSSPFIGSIIEMTMWATLATSFASLWLGQRV